MGKNAFQKCEKCEKMRFENAAGKNVKQCEKMRKM